MSTQLDLIPKSEWRPEESETGIPPRCVECPGCGCWLSPDDFCDECKERRAQNQVGENERINDPEQEFEE